MDNCARIIPNHPSRNCLIPTTIHIPFPISPFLHIGCTSSFILAVEFHPHGQEPAFLMMMRVAHILSRVVEYWRLFLFFLFFLTCLSPNDLMPHRIPFLIPSLITVSTLSHVFFGPKRPLLTISEFIGAMDAWIAAFIPFPSIVV